MKRKSVSIRIRIFLLFTISMLFVLALTFFLIRMVTASVMEKTLSEYLMSAVDTNADKITFLTGEKAEEAKKQNTSNLYIALHGGVLQVDDDFLVMLNNVESALYTDEGELLYGGNDALKTLPKTRFEDSRLYQTEINGVRYAVYDRRFVKKELEGLWIRGIVPLTRQTVQIQQITRSVLAFSPLIVLVILLVSALVAGGILKPIRRMRTTATEIAGGNDLNLRIPNQGSRDELYFLAESFNAMFERLEASFAREKQFTSDASHELRTPLTVILMQSEYMLRKAPQGSEEREAFAVIHRQAERMQTLVEDMLGLARIAQGGQRYPKERVCFSEVVRQIGEDMKPIALHGISLQVEAEPDIFLMGNRSLFERMVVNLIDNAYKYGKEKGHIEVTLVIAGKDTEMAGKQAVLTVADDGIGMSEEAKEHMYDRFYREDSSRGEVTGYGLGLSLVKEIVAYHQGEITVDSKKQEGTSFRICFPLIFLS